MMMTPAFAEIIGSLAAFLTTACWVPQAARTIRTRETRALSLPMYAILLTGNILWLIYGLAITSWPLIGSNIITGALVITILMLKLRHG